MLSEHIVSFHLHMAHPISKMFHLRNVLSQDWAFTPLTTSEPPTDSQLSVMKSLPRQPHKAGPRRHWGGSAGGDKGLLIAAHEPLLPATPTGLPAVFLRNVRVRQEPDLKRKRRRSRGNLYRLKIGREIKNRGADLPLQELRSSQI